MDEITKPTAPVDAPPEIERDAETGRAAYLEALGIDPLVSGRDFRAALGDPARETFSRKVSRGEVPLPDVVENGRNYWFASTVRKLLAEKKAVSAGKRVPPPVQANRVKAE